MKLSTLIKNINRHKWLIKVNLLSLFTIILSSALFSLWAIKDDLKTYQNEASIISQSTQLFLENSFQLSLDQFESLYDQASVIYESSPENFSEIISEVANRVIDGNKTIFQYRIINLVDGDELVKSIQYNDDSYRLDPFVELSNVENRYYFKEMIQGFKDNVYLSRLDLNVENGAIEVPYRPTIRFAKQISPSLALIVNFTVKNTLEFLLPTNDIELTRSEKPFNYDLYLRRDNNDILIHSVSKFDKQRQLWKEEKDFQNSFVDESSFLDISKAFVKISPNKNILLKENQAYFGGLISIRISMSEETFYSLSFIRNKVFKIADLFIFLMIFFLTYSYHRYRIAIKNRRKDLYIFNEKLERELYLRESTFTFLAHDLRGPLSSFIGITDVLSDGKSVSLDVFDNILFKLNLNLRSTLNIIDNLISWNTISKEIPHVEFVETPLKDIIEEKVKSFSSTIKAKNLAIEINNDIKTTQVVGSKSSLGRAIENLLLHAILTVEENETIKFELQNSENNIAIYYNDKSEITSSIALKLNFEAIRKVVPMREKASAFSLYLIKQIMEQNGGSLEILKKNGHNLLKLSFLKSCELPEIEINGEVLVFPKTLNDTIFIKSLFESSQTKNIKFIEDHKWEDIKAPKGSKLIAVNLDEEEMEAVLLNNKRVDVLLWSSHNNEEFYMKKKKLTERFSRAYKLEELFKFITS